MSLYPIHWVSLEFCAFDGQGMNHQPGLRVSFFERIKFEETMLPEKPAQRGVKSPINKLP